jgi:hypothetical protein
LIIGFLAIHLVSGVYLILGCLWELLTLNSSVVAMDYPILACGDVIYISLMERQGRGGTMVLYFALLRSWIVSPCFAQLHVIALFPGGGIQYFLFEVCSTPSTALRLMLVTF